MTTTTKSGRRIAVGNICSVAIILRASDPHQIMMETKDGGYPIKFYRHHLNFPGGNWIGEKAVNDGHTLGTLKRELEEEFSLDRPQQSTEELVDLGSQRGHLIGLDLSVSASHRVYRRCAAIL